MDINEILEDIYRADVVTLLKEGKNVSVPPIEKVRADYEPENHSINDKKKRPDKKVGGKEEPVARVALGLQKLATNRMTQFMFSIPVQRIYHGKEKSDTHAQVAEAIEKVYKTNHIDAMNVKRGRAMFSSCEVGTLWYTMQKEKHSKYGFETNLVIKSKVYDPMDGFKLYPYFDEYDDMVAMSFESRIKVSSTKEETYFETYTKDRHILWRTDGGVQVLVDEANRFGKIPYIYGNRENPIWDDVTPLIEEVEKDLSNNSDVIDYNRAPILTISGSLVGNETKGESRRVYRLEQGGSVQYVSWSQSNEAVRYNVDTMLKLMWLQLQLPDISLENLRGMNASGEAMKTLLADAHLKVGDEKYPFIEYFEREESVIKSILADINPKWKGIVDEITIEHVITPFIQRDEEAEISKVLRLTGNKQMMSQKEGIESLGWSMDSEATMKAIMEENKSETKRTEE